MEAPRTDKVAACLKACAKYTKCYLNDFSLNELNKRCLIYGYPDEGVSRTKYSHLRSFLNENT